MAPKNRARWVGGIEMVWKPKKKEEKKKKSGKPC